MNLKPIPKLALVMPLPPVLYFGCHEQAGHYVWVPGMRSLHSHDRDADRQNYTTLCKLDGQFAPQDTTAEGQAWFHSENVNGVRYCVISFWDYSVDERGGCNSTFLLTSSDKCYAKSFNDALADCRAAFPEVFSRFKFEIHLRRNMFA